MHTIQSAAAALAAGRATARQLVEDCLARIAAPSGEGARVFTRVHADAARASADAMDTLRRVGRAPGPLAGIPVSVKDLLDIAGEPTPGGSRVLADAPPATAHAAVVARLLAAGLVLIGRTNMTEFAFSGLGINPHYGTPASPWDRATRRIPGGSSSGAAVSVADGMAIAALGTDTGGSCRIPAAMCGVVGYKPTARRVPLDGCLPLSASLDSIGPLARSVACCATIDAVLAGEPLASLVPADVAGLRLGVPTNIVFDGADDAVVAAFDAALARLAAAGARIERRAFPSFDAIGPASRAGTFAGAEAFAWHEPLLDAKGDGYDPLIRKRIERGAVMTGSDYVKLREARTAIQARAHAETAHYDAVVMPTCPLLPAPIAALEANENEYNRVNLMQLRNTTIGNFLDRCAISLPCTTRGAPPVGLMLMGETMADARLFAVAAAVEAAIAA